MVWFSEPTCRVDWPGRWEVFSSRIAEVRTAMGRMLCPCLRRPHCVAPADLASGQLHFVDVAAGCRLHVLHVQPIASSGAQRTDGSQDDHLTTADFWFNHWEGPYITAVDPARRKASTNTFGPADAVGRVRKASVAAPLSLAEVTVRQLLEQTVSDVVWLSATRRQAAGGVDTRHGVANPAYEPSGDDQIELGVSLPDATLDETETDEAPPQPQPPPPLPAPAAKPTLLFFLHGVGGSADVWTTQIKAFCHQGYECVAPDLLGHGFSSAPRSACLYSFQNQLQQLRCVFRKYATSRRRVVVIGHGYGASLATVLAREYLCVVLLVLVSGGGPTPLVVSSSRPLLPSCLLTCLKPLLFCGFKTREMLYTPRGKVIEVEKAYDVPSYVLQHTKKGQLWPEGDLSFHKQITLPTLLIHGMKDKFVSLVEMCDMEKAIPRAFLETVPNAGHLVMLEAAEETNRLLGQFLRRWLHSARPG